LLAVIIIFDVIPILSLLNISSVNLFTFSNLKTDSSILLLSAK